MDWDAVPDSFKDATGKKFVPGGTPMGQTANGIAPRKAESEADAGDGLPAFCLLATNANEGSELQNRSSYGVIRGGVIYENLLPGGSLAAEVKAELAAAGTGFAWTTYRDTTA
jgi:hypothetical protein